MSNNDLPNDDLLQFVCGELNNTRYAAVRNAIAVDAELAAMAQGLASAVAAVRAENIGQVSDDFNDRLRRQLLQVLDSKQTETIRPTCFARSLANWRSIMRHPVSRVTAMAIFVLAVTGVALWFHAGGTQYAFADFIKPILEAKSAKFKAIFEHDGKQVAIANIMVSAPNRVREEVQRPGQPVEITIEDDSKGVSLSIDSAKKIAVINKLVGLPRERASMNLLDEMRSLIRDAKRPDVKRESLGEKEVDGHRAVGWRLSGPGLHDPGVTVTIWGDPQTGLPIRMESSFALTGNKSTLSDCILNPNFDESMFNLDPPAGYRILNIQTDLSPVTEKDLTETLRGCGEVYGAFPDTLNMQAIYEIGKRLPEKDGHKIDDLCPLAMRGFGFVLDLPPEADAHYAGKGVSLGAAGTPIFWYRPKDAKKYRVIYADLSVREADTPPSVPSAWRVPAQSSSKQ
jgi:outer membrane lipoprotein-sorting protein